MQQEYPAVTVEKKILSKEMALTGEVDQEFCDKLVDWADVIRKTCHENREENLRLDNVLHIPKVTKRNIV